MKRIEVTQSGKGMKKGLNLLGESENFVMLYSVRKIVSAYVDHTLIIQRSWKKDWYKKINNTTEIFKSSYHFKILQVHTEVFVQFLLFQ